MTNSADGYLPGVQGRPRGRPRKNPTQATAGARRVPQAAQNVIPSFEQQPPFYMAGFQVRHHASYFAREYP